ncbi:MAG: LysM peptidoglycan-binding domain-containing protein [Oscillospiraceae bacterium]|nr:LysM peptidoglycan-binding domain-containing protein [Oscillospiraceae bacterium]
MKKRLISILLVAVLVVSLFAGYNLSANAETVSYSTMTYQMKSGDYVLRICQKLGLNYYTCKIAIMKLNNISDNQWNKLAVGRVLTLPATDADAVVIATGHGSTAKTATAATSSITTPVATVSTASSTTAKTTTKTTTTQSAIDTAISKDTCWWYMVPYKLAMGETVTDACNALGVSYKKYKSTIQKINKITNWNSIPAGTTLWIPSVAKPANGTSCITVYRHLMKSGETAYGVVTDRGLDYNAIKPMLEIINEEHSNLAKLKAGDPFYYPVATTISLPSDTTSNNKTTTTSSDGTTTVVQTYKLTSAIDTAAANVEFFVNGKQVKEAKAGDTVNVSVNTKAGRAAKNVRVKFANGQADLLLKSFSFTMPSCDIQIDADVMKGHNITVDCNYIGKAATLVDGVSMNAAATGAAVTVVSLDSGLVPTEVYVSYKTMNGVKREALTNIDQGFIMPDADVKVEVTLEAVPTYAFYVIDVPNGSYSVQVNGNNVTRAAKGAQVTIVAKPNNGYIVGDAVIGGQIVRGITVQRHDNGNFISAFNNTFTMPAADVDVVVNFVPKGNNQIVINPVQGGQFYATVGAPDPNPNPTPTSIRNDADREAGTNSRVYLNWLPEDAADTSYAMVTDPNNADAYIVTRISDGLRVPVVIDDTGVWFRMPVGGATVTGAVQRAQRIYTGSVFLDGQAINQYQDASLYLQADSEALRNEYQITNDGAAAQHPANVGEYVNVSYSVSSKNVALDHYEVWVNGAIDPMLTSELQKNSCFQMPTFAQVAGTNTVFEVCAYFVSNMVKITPADMKVTGLGTIGIVDGTNGLSVNGVKAGVPFWLSVAPGEGYVYDADGSNPASITSSLRVFRKDTGGEILPIAGPIPHPTSAGSYMYCFDAMPADGVKVEAVFEKLGYILNITTIDENGDPLTGGSYVKITRNSSETVVDNLATQMSVEYGDTISVALTQVGSSEYEFVSTDVNNFISKKTSFKVTGDFATNPINLIIRLKSKSLTAVKNPIKLNHSVNDSTRGNVEYVILDSPSGLSALNTFTSVAYAGDLVAIIPSAAPGYYTDPWNISVKVDGGHMDLAETTVDGKTAYTFTMPQKNYKSVTVNFQPIKYNLTLNVLDQNGDPVSLGYVKVIYEKADADADVLPSGNNFKSIPYGSTVKILMTDLAVKMGVTMDKATFTVTPKTLPVPGNKTVADTIENSGNGKKFVMPAGDCTVTVKLNDVPAGIEPVDVTLPSTAKVDGGSVKLKYVTEADEVLTDLTVKSGTKLKVMVDEDLQEKVLDGPIAFLKGTDKLVEVADGEFFTVPENPDDLTQDYTLTAETALATKQYQVQIAVENAPSDAALTVSVDGGATASIPISGTTLSPMVVHGKNIKIENTDSSDPAKFLVDGLSASSDSAATSVDKPLKPEGKNNGDTVVLTVKFESPTVELPEKDNNGYALSYTTSGGEAVDREKAPVSTDIYVKPTSDAPAGKYYKVEVNGEELTQNSDGTFGPFQVTEDLAKEKIVVTTHDKVVTVAITFNNAPSGLKTEVNGTVSTDSSVTVSDVKEASKEITIILHEPADYEFDNPGGDTDKYSANKDATYKYTMTVDMSAVNNGDTVSISLDILTPARTLPAKTDPGNRALTFYDKNGNVVEEVADGEVVYVDVKVAKASRYLDAVSIKGTALSKQTSGVNKGHFGPYTVTSNIEETDVVETVKEKVITLNFSYAGDAASKVYLSKDSGSTTEPNNATINVTEGGTGGTAKLADVMLMVTSPDAFSAEGTKGDNVTVTFDGGNAEATFGLDFSKLENNQSVSISVALQ